MTTPNTTTAAATATPATKGTYYATRRKDGTGTKRLFKAPNRSRVMGHIAEDEHECWVPDADELLELGREKVKVEVIGAAAVTAAEASDAKGPAR